MKSDEIDSQIVSILRKNSRTPNVEIAEIVGLTEGAVRHRVTNLITNGTIRRFTVETGSGTNFGVVMVKAKSETKKMMSTIKSLDICFDAYEIAGEFDGCIILEGNSIEEIDQKIDRIRALAEVSDTRTFIAVRKW